MATIDRTSRDKETRAATERERPWTPPGSFPMDLNDSAKASGVRYRWVRTHYNGAEEDKANVYKRMQSGWRPVKAEDLPDLEYLKDAAGNIALNGCVLCKNAEETVQKAVKYYERQATGQMEAAASEFTDGDRNPLVPKFSEGNLRTRTIRQF